MSNKLIEEAVEELEVICKQADQYQINAGYPVDTPAKEILRQKITTLLTAQLTELEGEVLNIRGVVFGNDIVARNDVLTLLAEKKKGLKK